MIETAKSDPALTAVSEYSVVIEHPCNTISLSKIDISDQVYMIGNKFALVVDVPEAVISPTDLFEKCPRTKHTYEYSMICGYVESDWLTINQESH